MLLLARSLEAVIPLFLRASHRRDRRRGPADRKRCADLCRRARHAGAAGGRHRRLHVRPGDHDGERAAHHPAHRRARGLRPAQTGLWASAGAGPGVLRAQSHRRPDGARDQRHRPGARSDRFGLADHPGQRVHGGDRHRRHGPAGAAADCRAAAADDPDRPGRLVRGEACVRALARRAGGIRRSLRAGAGQPARHPHHPGAGPGRQRSAPLRCGERRVRGALSRPGAAQFVHQRGDAVDGGVLDDRHHRPVAASSCAVAR
jgi:hypothetical protein